MNNETKFEIDELVFDVYDPMHCHQCGKEITGIFGDIEWGIGNKLYRYVYCPKCFNEKEEIIRENITQ